MAALKEIGKLWRNDGAKAGFKPAGAPIIASNLAKNQPANSN